MAEQEECVEWTELGECVKFKKKKDGRLVADFKGCTIKMSEDKKFEQADEFRKRLRKGVEIIE